MPTTDPSDDQRLIAIYEETARVASAFWAWRHKVILLCGATLGGVLAVASWLYQQELVTVLWAPFLVGSVIVGGCAAFDRRNAEILNDCFEVAAGLERCLLGKSLAPTGSPFAKLKASHTQPPERREAARKWTYTWTLERGYLGIASLLAVTFLAFVLLAIFSSASLRHGTLVNERQTHSPRYLRP
jgi:hypothetical protein